MTTLFLLLVLLDLQQSSFAFAPTANHNCGLCFANRWQQQQHHKPLSIHAASSQEEEEDIDGGEEDQIIIPINNDKSILSGQSTFTKYGRPQDINADSFGPLLPIAEAVDEVTGGWALTYADLHPATPRTTIGQAFLATNIFYAAGGLALGVQGDWFYGGLTELAGIVSFIYHYSQLEFGKNRSEVRLALLVDYFTAGAALICGGIYMIQLGIDSIPLEALITAVGAAVCLSLCWVWEFGYPYIFWHSLWHILSAFTGYLIGQDHIISG